MANIKSAIKRIRVSAKSAERNKAARSRMRTFIKKVMTAIEAGDVEAAQSALREASSVITRSAKNGVIHKKQASRRVKRLNRRVKELALASAS
ncbi:MAG: 30S ribosomal protein S20 [Magnetococcales bacterium]|nr:30S ribosomal protein S20 [Magnetococcales bacterium]